MLTTKVYFCVFIFQLCVNFSYSLIYDIYTGLPATKNQLRFYDHIHQTRTCTVNIKPCNASERSRIDGSCNNLEYPTRGTSFSPPERVLPALYYKGSYSRKSVSGKDLVLPRKARVDLLSQGKTYNLELTQLLPAFAVFIFSDVGSVHDLEFMLINKTDCCEKEGRSDYMCTPNIIAKDDPVHRFSGIRCMNLTRPLTYQYFGCTDDPVPTPIRQTTAVYDLSQIYNDNMNSKTVRAFRGGLLLVDIYNDITWPPFGNGYCPANNPGEKCFKNNANALLSLQLFSTWFLRNHNYYAKQLAKINPCWDDEMLFQVARDINIGFMQQIRIYEFLMTIIGKKRLIESGIISGNKANSECPGFRDIYDSKFYPTITLEYAYILRWFHLLQHGTARMYKPDGTFIRDYPIVNASYHTDYVTRDKNIFYFTQGHFRQPAAKARHTVDYDMAERGLPYIQLAMDVPTTDVHKGRLLGLRPYIDYLKFCFGYKITTFEQLKVIMKKNSIEQLKDLYEDVRDIDLMSGVWSENAPDEGKVPPTVACLMGDNIYRAIKGDRHWYERPNRPYAYTPDQLGEIRKVTLSSLLCCVGDSVTKIQKHAFLNISPENPLVSCDEIPKIDISKWRDPKCKSSTCKTS